MKEKTPNLLISACVFSVCLAVSICVLTALCNAKITEVKSRAGQQCELITSSLCHRMDSLFSSTAYVRQIAESSGNDSKQVKNLAEEIESACGGIVSAIAWGNNEKNIFCFPLENKGSLEGILAEFFSSEDREKYITKDGFSLFSKVTSAGKSHPSSGLLLLFSQGTVEKNDYFSASVIDFTKVLNSVDIESIKKEGYDYRLWRKRYSEEDFSVLSESNSRMFSSSVDFTVKLSNEEWTLSVVPKNGWISLSYCFLVSLLALVFSFLFAACCFCLLYIQQKDKVLTQYLYIDAVTRLPNEKSLEKELLKSEADENPFGILYIDLNGWSTIRERIGNKRGGEALNIIARKIRNSVRQGDIVYRIVDDEFVIFARGQFSRLSYEGMSSRIISSLEKPMTLKDRTVVNVAASMGYGSYPADGKTGEEVMAAAKNMMKKNKERKKQEAESSLKNKDVPYESVR